MMNDSDEELMVVIEQVKDCDDSPEEILLSLTNLFDFSSRQKKGIVANSIYGYIMEIENN
jgi:hypothetical protein